MNGDMHSAGVLPLGAKLAIDTLLSFINDPSFLHRIVWCEATFLRRSPSQKARGSYVTRTPFSGKHPGSMLPAWKRQTSLSRLRYTDLVSQTSVLRRKWGLRRCRGENAARCLNVYFILITLHSSASFRPSNHLIVHRPSPASILNELTVPRHPCTLVVALPIVL